jgi:hypothetical protein
MKPTLSAIVLGLVVFSLPTWAQCPASEFPFNYDLPPQWSVINCEILVEDPSVWMNQAIRSVPYDASHSWRRAVEAGTLTLFVRSGPNDTDPTAVVYIPSYSSRPKTPDGSLSSYCDVIRANLAFPGPSLACSEPKTVVLHECYETEVAGFPTLYSQQSVQPEDLWHTTFQVFVSEHRTVVLNAMCLESALPLVGQEFDDVVSSLVSLKEEP